MTPSQARRVLGKEVQNVSDEDLEQDIQAAELLKNFFFGYYPLPNLAKKPKMTGLASRDMP
jgi:hypothetical protein